MSSSSSSLSTVSTSSLSTQAHLFPSTSAIILTIQSESLLLIPIPNNNTSPDNNLNISASSLETETRPLRTSNKFAALPTEIQPLVPLPVSVPTTSNSEHSIAPEIPKCVKRNSRNIRKRSKVQKAEIEIKMAPHIPRNSAPTTMTRKDMIMYDVQTEELEPNPEDKFAMKECFANNPSEYMRALTPTDSEKNRSPPPLSPTNVWTSLQDSWYQLLPALLKTLIESISRRVAALLRARENPARD
ncbi:hypothetical protein TNCV_3898991 [Trichonephila clavipes]|nr:hypothetical protein TNCV_3898991 [Trichonephila clavipes]